MAICAGVIVADAENILSEHRKNIADSYNPYYFVMSEQSEEIYDYISENTPESAQIAFVKPRALALMTDRLAFNPGVNGHSLMDADYFLWDGGQIDLTHEPTEEEYSRMTLLYENDVFRFYAINKAAD